MFFCVSYITIFCACKLAQLTCKAILLFVAQNFFCHDVHGLTFHLLFKTFLMRPIIAFLAAAASFGSIAITASPSQAETYMCIKNGGAYTLKAELHGTKGTSSKTFTNPNSNCFNLDTIGTEVGDSYKLVVISSGGTTGGAKTTCVKTTRGSDTSKLYYESEGTSSNISCRKVNSFE